MTALTTNITETPLFSDAYSVFLLLDYLADTKGGEWRKYYRDYVDPTEQVNEMETEEAFILFCLICEVAGI